MIFLMDSRLMVIPILKCGVYVSGPSTPRTCDVYTVICWARLCPITTSYMNSVYCSISQPLNTFSFFTKGLCVEVCSGVVSVTGLRTAMCLVEAVVLWPGMPNYVFEDRSSENSRCLRPQAREWSITSRHDYPTNS